MSQSAAVRNLGRSLVNQRVDERMSESLPSLADDPGFLDALDDLDRGVYGFFDNSRVIVKRRPLMAQLVVPRAAAPRASGVISAWAASWIILAMFAGASAAGFAFHARLSQVVDRWERTGKDRARSAVLTASARSVQ